jgi:tetratricopeptide (TPR) repeat protein
MSEQDPGDADAPSPAVDELLRDASFAHTQCDLREGLALCDEAEKVAAHDRDRAQIAHTRGALLISAGDFVGARGAMERAVALFKEKVPASTWGNLGHVLDKQREFSAAAVAHRRCLAVLERELGGNHPRVFKQLGDLAYALWGLHECEEAEALLREAVHRFEAQTEREPLWHARALSNLGYFLFRARKAPTAALECFDRAEAMRDAASLRIKGRVLREGFPPDFEASLLGNRAEAVASLGRLQEAAELRARADAFRRAAAREREKAGDHGS